MIIPNLIAPPSGRASAPDDPAFDYLARVAADSGQVLDASGLIQNVNRYKIPNAMGSNLFDKASIVIDANGGIKAGKVYALKPANGDVDLSWLRNSTAWLDGPDGGLVERAVDVPGVTWNQSLSRWEILPQTGSTQQIRNNTMDGAVVGAPGTLPTGWSVNTRGLSREVIATGVEKNINYIDVRFHGTANANATVELNFIASNLAPALSGQTWNASFFYQLRSAINPPVSQDIYLSERSAAGSDLAATTTPILNPSIFSRKQTSRLLNNGSTAFVLSRASFTVLNGSEYDFTIRIGVPQLEQSLFASSVIKTTNAIASRAVDVCEKTNIAALIGQSQGTIIMDFHLKNENAIRALFAISDGTASNRIRVRRTDATTLSFERNKAGSSNAIVNISGVPASGRIKMVCAYSASEGGICISVNGSEPVILSGSNEMFTNELTEIALGSLQDGTNQFNNGIAYFVHVKERLSNDEIQEASTL